MPAVSKAQARFMGAVCGGAVHKPGLSKEKACEYVHGQSVKDLPEHFSKPKRRKHG
jgi:hypothetical protein